MLLPNLSTLFREMYTSRAVDWCMEEYPNACKPQLDSTSFLPQYFQIKDTATGLVLEVNDRKLSFAESNGLSNQMWFLYEEYNSQAPEGVFHIINRLTQDMLENWGPDSDDYKEVTAGNSYWLDASDKHKHQLWTTADGKIFSRFPGYTVMAVRDGKLVALKEGTESTVAISDPPQQEYPLTITGNQCTTPPPPPEGIHYPYYYQKITSSHM